MATFQRPLARCGAPAGARIGGLLAVAALLLSVPAGTSMTARRPGTSQPTTAQPVLRLAGSAAMTQAEEDFTVRVFRIVNRKRTHHGLHRVRWNTCVNGFSDHWADFLVGNDLYQHSDLQRLLYRCDSPYVEENIAKLDKGATPRLLVRLWMHSPEHRANILSTKVTAGGLCIRWDTNRHVWIAVQNFAKRPGSL
jgi:uncharacterized protein YkwD